MIWAEPGTVARAAFALGGTDTGRAEPPAFAELSAPSGKNAERPADPAARPEGPLTGAELGTEADPETGAELGTEADPETGTEADPETGAAELRTAADPETGAELGTEADPDTGLAAPACPDDAHSAPAAGGGGSSYP
ncbi:hypothetical protein AB0368_06110 [Actinoplanes sp. NPDC051475]|uniref:hypothetical protein n=1 Tax=Actinoplanes sp. NPDC051475 TaxID=3157225 RepID=UPI00344F5A74